MAQHGDSPRSRPRSFACRSAAVGAAVLLAASACQQESADTEVQLVKLQRRGRFGSLRDFVLFTQPQDPPGAALLVDRFEVTQDDWAQFADTEVGGTIAVGITTRGVGALPVSNMDLAQARAFAHWRMGRLPTEHEWRLVTADGGNTPFPWGVKQFATHANTGDIGLGEAVPVGTFESGRRAGGNMPYDLIGNVREWTESVSSDWFETLGPQGSRSFASVWRESRRIPALSAWGIHGLLPLGAIASVGGPDVPRKVVGSDFLTPMRDVADHLHDTQISGERSQRTGLRVYTTVDELLVRLLTLPGSPTTAERRQLLRFVKRNGHWPVLKAAFEASPMATVTFAPDSIGNLLATELHVVTPEPR